MLIDMEDRRTCCRFRFDIMCRCWNDEPTARPTFDELVTWIDHVISKARPAATRMDDSRLYLNIVNSSASDAEPLPHSQQPSAAVPPSGAGLPAAQTNGNDIAEDDVRYT